MIPVHGFFSGLTEVPQAARPGDRLRRAASPGLILLVNLGFEKVYATLVSFVVGGFYIAFLFPVIAALVLHLKGKHEPGPFNLGGSASSSPCWRRSGSSSRLVNICWPRYPDLPWYQNWGTILMIAVLDGRSASSPTFWRRRTRSTEMM